MSATLLQLGILSVLLVTSNVFLKLHFTAHPLSGGIGPAAAWSTLLALLASVHAWLALAAMGGAVCIWIVMINQHPLSLVYPMVSLSYVLMIFADWAIFQQPPSLAKFLGAGLICLGIAVLSR